MLDPLPTFDSSANERLERNAQRDVQRAAVYRRVSVEEEQPADANQKSE